MAEGTPPASPTARRELMAMLDGYERSQALHVAAKLWLVEAIRAGARTLEDIARVVGVHEPALRRLLRFLVAANILGETEPGVFAVTPMGEMLAAAHPQSIYRWAVLLGSPIIWRPWGELYTTVTTGQSAFDAVFGEPYFPYLDHHPDEAANFNAAMTDDGGAATILGAYDFSGGKRIVDVGAVTGSCSAPSSKRIRTRAASCTTCRPWSLERTSSGARRLRRGASWSVETCSPPCPRAATSTSSSGSSTIGATARPSRS